MFKVVKGKTHNLKDVAYFIDIINTLKLNPIPQAQTFFNTKDPIIISRAPGRLDVMGGIADYSGSLVLQLPIKEATLSALQKTTDRSIRIISLREDKSHRQNYFEMLLGDFLKDGNAIDYKFAQNYFYENKLTKWTAYVAGAFLVLMKELNIKFKHGVNILIHSDIPEGKGVSSSAALEVAAMCSIVNAFNIKISYHNLVLLCQKVENLVVGAPCGIMDQMTSAFGRENQLLSLLCQPAELKPFIDIPEQISFWGIDSGIKHSVSGKNYISVRVGAFMGQRIISELMKKHATEIDPTIQNKYLANISPSDYETHFMNHIPDKIKGDKFIKLYENTIDEVTEIDPDFIYKVGPATAHPIYENSRVQTFAKLLSKPLTINSCESLGKLMYESHKSYSDCGLSSSGTDQLVELSKKIGSAKGIYGAKITGGGSGGTVVILGKRDSDELIEEIIHQYSNDTGYRPYLFSGSSMGALEFESVTLKDS